MVLVRIYKIENNINELIYIGSTVKSLDERLSDHRNDMCYYSKQLFHTMHQLGCHNFYISLITEIECDDLDDARYEEQEEISKYANQILLNKWISIV
jgi:GIY-YIG catalytic domain